VSAPGLLVNVDVDDLEKATRFYCDGLGLRVGRRFDGWIARAKAAGATIEKDVAAHAYGKLALLADPFGNGFCLLQFTGRGYDEIVK
jgi:predicted enzyme related to lactoylglutathione lyase